MGYARAASKNSKRSHLRSTRAFPLDRHNALPSRSQPLVHLLIQVKGKERELEGEGRVGSENREPKRKSQEIAEVCYDQRRLEDDSLGGVMVRFLKRGNSLERLVHGRSMRQTHSPAMEHGGGCGSERTSEMEERSSTLSRSQGTVGLVRQAGYALERSDKALRSPLGKDGSCASPSDRQPSGNLEDLKEETKSWLNCDDLQILI